ncbi:MAG: hypothetical protein PHO20_00255 [Candidatus Peribacteraceae bacterium]|nr:hypothetical protein [Candidatus Peribacteraceae bacterium]MDD5739189.1 hypothetical protein [Candidatus Peribacteraceae bacterium]
MFMLDDLPTYEVLVESIDLKEKLRTADNPQTVIDAISAAFERIQMCCLVRREETPLNSIRLHDRLQEIQVKVADCYQRIVLPDNYRKFWTAAQEELDGEMQSLITTLDHLRSQSGATKAARANAWFEQYQVTASEMKSEDIVTDINAFLAWRKKEESKLEEQIRTLQEIKQKLIENAPPSDTDRCSP